MPSALNECRDAAIADYLYRPARANGQPIEIGRMEHNATHIFAFDAAGKIVAAWSYTLHGYFGGWRIERDDDRMIVPPGVMVHLGRQFAHVPEMLKRGYVPRPGRAPRRFGNE